MGCQTGVEGKVIEITGMIEEQVVWIDTKRGEDRGVQILHRLRLIGGARADVVG